MNGQKLEHMRRYLSRVEVRRKILEEMVNWRSTILVTIGRAARLFHLSENQLRDWEDHGLLRPMRQANHRQYSLEDLDKLAVIRELINANFAPGDIPADIDEIANVTDLRRLLSTSLRPEHYVENVIPIDQHIEQAKDEVWWRFFASHVLRVSLLLISEASSNSTVGILLPLADMPALSVEDISVQGVSLVGWLNGDKSVHVFLTPHPSFRYPIDYYLYPLAPMKNGERLKMPEDSTLLVLERKDTHSRSLSLSESIVDLICRLLAPFYEEKQKIQECFDVGMKGEYIAVRNLHGVASSRDILIEEIANMVIRWGGYREDKRKHWRFCTIVLPTWNGGERVLSEQDNAIISAQSNDEPYIIGEPTSFLLKSIISLSIRVYQGSYVVYRPELSKMDVIAITSEGLVRSYIAIPVGGEQGLPLAVLYVASNELAAFSETDQRLLRIACRLIEDVLLTYQAHEREAEKLNNLLNNPITVDAIFAEFLSENDFMHNIEVLLTNIDHKFADGKEDLSGKLPEALKAHELPPGEEVLSFIALELDDLKSLTSKYGYEIIRQLNKALGLRIRDLIPTLITMSANCQLYYMYGSRFYLTLPGFTLENAREKAERLRKNLAGNIAIKLSGRSDNLLINITVHSAVNSYKYVKLKQMIQVYGSIIDTCAKMGQGLDVALNKGIEEGGNVVISWYPETGSYNRVGFLA